MTEHFDQHCIAYRFHLLLRQAFTRFAYAFN